MTTTTAAAIDLSWARNEITPSVRLAALKDQARSAVLLDGVVVGEYGRTTNSDGLTAGYFVEFYSEDGELTGQRIEERRETLKKSKVLGAGYHLRVKRYEAAESMSAVAGRLRRRIARIARIAR